MPKKTHNLRTTTDEFERLLEETRYWLKKNELLQSYVNSQRFWSNIIAPYKQCCSREP
jgi:hypothetical protein